MGVEFISGTRVLDRLGADLDEIHAATATPVTARRPWLSTWVRCNPEVEPLALVVRGAQGRIDAVALLGRRARRSFTEFVALGHGCSDQVRLPARDAASADLLARAVSAHLRAVPGRWRLVVRHLPGGDPVAARIAAELPCAKVVPGDVSPALRFGPSRSLRSHVSRNHHQQVRRMMNRMRRDELFPVIEHLREPAAIAAVLPQVEEVCRRRDIDLRGQSSLDHNGTGAFFRQVILEHALRGEVELTALRLRGELAAYVLCFNDNGSRRMWNCRLSPAWRRYGPGRIANNAALGKALADGRCTEFDWMRGNEPYKSGMSNHVERSQDLLAWSDATLRTILDTPRRLKCSVKGFMSRHELLQAAWGSTRPVRRQLRRAAAVLRRSRG